jgi:DNA primase
MHVDFAEVRKIPIASALKFYKVYARKRSETELIADCPFPSHKTTQHANKNQTLAISTEKNRWYCHSDSCRAASNKPKGGDVIDLVAMLENLTALDAAKRLAELFAIRNQPSEESGAGDKDRDAKNEKPSHEGKNTPLAFELKNLNPDHPFIKERGITLETAKEFGIGFHGGKGSMSNRICFPLHEDGSLIGYCGRATNGDDPKWKMPLGLVKSFLYALERCDPTKPILLVESTWAVLWLHQNGCQATALLGSTTTAEQEALLAPYAEIRVALDNDNAGREAAKKIVERLRKNHKVSTAYLKG